MSKIHVSASEIIDASPQDVYAIIADYRVGHPAILPEPYFSELIVDEGGFGAGTVIRFSTTVLGVTQAYHMDISEPEPGRVLVETDRHTGQVSTFTIEPEDDGRRARVTITSEADASPGIKGVLERLLNPSIVGRIFKQELRKLNAYVRSRPASGSGQAEAPEP